MNQAQSKIEFRSWLIGFLKGKGMDEPAIQEVIGRFDSIFPDYPITIPYYPPIYPTWTPTTTTGMTKYGEMLDD